MADPTPDELQEQYAAIELLYSEGQWSAVLQASEALLAALAPVACHPLRPRLQLVLGHTLLYGLADLNGAEEHYRTALLNTQQPLLREIAEQGLRRCSEQREATIEQTEEVPAELGSDVAAEAATEVVATAAPAVMPREVEVGGASGAAMPWLRELKLDPSAAARDGGDAPFSSSVRSARNAETPHGQQVVVEAESIREPLQAAQETLALLREPDAQPEANTHPPAVEADPQELSPSPAQEEPPLSPEVMAALAQGLLEVVLR